MNAIDFKAQWAGSGANHGNGRWDDRSQRQKDAAEIDRLVEAAVDGINVMATDRSRSKAAAAGLQSLVRWIEAQGLGARLSAPRGLEAGDGFAIDAAIFRCAMDLLADARTTPPSELAERLRGLRPGVPEGIVVELEFNIADVLKLPDPEFQEFLRTCSPAPASVAPVASRVPEPVANGYQQTSEAVLQPELAAAPVVAAEPDSAAATEVQAPAARDPLSEKKRRPQGAWAAQVSPPVDEIGVKWFGPWPAESQPAATLRQTSQACGKPARELRTGHERKKLWIVSTAPGQFRTFFPSPTPIGKAARSAKRPKKLASVRASKRVAKSPNSVKPTRKKRALKRSP